MRERLSSGPFSITKQDVQQVVSLYKEGWGVRNIRRKTGIPESTLVTILRGQHRFNKVRIMNGKRSGKDLAIYKKG
jgi:hypothetical protein